MSERVLQRQNAQHSKQAKHCSLQITETILHKHQLAMWKKTVFLAKIPLAVKFGAWHKIVMLSIVTQSYQSSALTCWRTSSHGHF